MKFIAGCLKGIEDIAIEEIKEKLNVDSKKICNGRIIFEAEELKELRGVHFISELIDYFEINDIRDIIDKVKKLDFYIFGEEINLYCLRDGNHNFNSQDVRDGIGKIIYDNGLKVNYKGKNIFYIDIVDNLCFLGKLINKDLNKRKYRIRRNNQGIDACLAYSLFKIIDIKKEDVVFDPFCKDCVILIEGFFDGYKNLYGFDSKGNNLRNGKINVKFAKAEVKFSNWNELDSVDNVITAIPIEAEHNRRRVEGVLRDFFDYAKKKSIKNIIVTCFKTDVLERELFILES